MKIVCNSFEELEYGIKNGNRKIIMWGAGLVGSVIVPELLNQWGLIDHIDCYIDNDSSKWGTHLSIFGKSIPIRQPKYIESTDHNSVLFINISRFSEVIHQIDSIRGSENLECYIMPMLLVHNYCLDKSEGDPTLTSEPQIPKKIHYMWLGGKKIPDPIQKCIDSWSRYCPDYEIIEWNENNYDLNKNGYMKEAYEAGGYGFVPDYARLDILYNHGGIYLDTDVELVRNLDPLLYQNCFCCLEKWQDISFGGCSGSIAGHRTIKQFIDARENLHFINPDGTQNRNTCGFFDTRTALDLGYRINGRTQNVADMNIYAYDYFIPYDYMTGRIVKTEHTFSIHWYNGGWMTDEMKMANENVAREYEQIYQNALKGGQRI